MGGRECIPAFGPVDILGIVYSSRRGRALFGLTLGARLRILAGSFYDQCTCLGAGHEAHLSTEQPPSQEDPRLPRAHGHQGRPPRAEPAPREGPQASVGLTTGPSRPVPPPAARCLPRERRLTDKPQFDAVHRQGIRSSDAYFLVIARPNELGHARLGLAVGVRSAGNAVNRNRIKRVVRESFRLRQQELPPVDLVVNARPTAGKATNAEITASVVAHWSRIAARCAKS